MKEYQNGETPNPDIYCNKYIKFNAFYRYAKESLSADAIATGHYARTSFGPFLENFCSNQSKNSNKMFNYNLVTLDLNIPDVKLLQAADKRKDQTFFLSQISQNSLRETMFPLGSMMKPEIKRLAADIGLTRIVKKRESMGICFIGKRKFSDFMSEYVDVKAGEMVDIDSGAVIAHHKGIHHYTIGQGVNVAGMKHKMFAVRKLPDRRTVLVAAGTKHPALQFDLIYTHQPHWIDRSPFDRSNKIVLTVDFRFQHGHKLEICDIVQTQSGLLVKLSKPVRAICAGQFAVFYEGNECLGSAKILATGPSEHILNS